MTHLVIPPKFMTASRERRRKNKWLFKCTAAMGEIAFSPDKMREIFKEPKFIAEQRGHYTSVKRSPQNVHCAQKAKEVSQAEQEKTTPLI